MRQAPPIVGGLASSKLPSEKRCNREVLPTPESPTSRICKNILLSDWSVCVHDNRLLSVTATACSRSWRCCALSDSAADLEQMVERTTGRVSHTKQVPESCDAPSLRVDGAHRKSPISCAESVAFTLCRVASCNLFRTSGRHSCCHGWRCPAKNLVFAPFNQLKSQLTYKKCWRKMLRNRTLTRATLKLFELKKRQSGAPHDFESCTSWQTLFDRAGMEQGRVSYEVRSPLPSYFRKYDKDNLSTLRSCLHASSRRES